MTAPSGLMSRREAWEYLGCSRTTLDRCIAAGEVEVTRLGGIKFTKEALDELIRLRTVGAQVKPAEAFAFKRPSLRDRKASAGIA